MPLSCTVYTYLGCTSYSPFFFFFFLSKKQSQIYIYIYIYLISIHSFTLPQKMDNFDILVGMDFVVCLYTRELNVCGAGKMDRKVLICHYTCTVRLYSLCEECPKYPSEIHLILPPRSSRYCCNT